MLGTHKTYGTSHYCNVFKVALRSILPSSEVVSSHCDTVFGMAGTRRAETKIKKIQYYKIVIDVLACRIDAENNINCVAVCNDGFDRTLLFK